MANENVYLKQRKQQDEALSKSSKVNQVQQPTNSNRIQQTPVQINNNPFIGNYDKKRIHNGFNTITISSYKPKNNDQLYKTSKLIFKFRISTEFTRC